MEVVRAIYRRFEVDIVEPVGERCHGIVAVVAWRDDWGR